MGKTLEQGWTMYLSSLSDEVGSPEWTDVPGDMIYAKGYFEGVDSGEELAAPLVMLLNPERTEEDRTRFAAQYEELGTVVVTAEEGEFEANPFTSQDVKHLLKGRGSY